MIIVRLIGGLGNQMFQYAAGRSLAHHHNTDLFLDLTWFASFTLRKYELDSFRINAKIASPDQLKHVSRSRKDAVCLGIRHIFFGETVFQYVNELTFDSHEKAVYLPDNVYLDGYWQSEKFFTEIPDIMKNELLINTLPSPINQELLNEINGCDSVSLHIRRGDYVSNPKTMELHGVLGIEYYMQALNLIRETVNDPHIFVFSDDIPWVRENLKTNLPLYFIDHNGADKGYEDLRLMSNCKHHIIANSSFSWWGAWLNKNPNKIVIAPNKWFNELKKDTRDLIPESWYKI
jgi:hypothetical protein